MHRDFTEPGRLVWHAGAIRKTRGDATNGFSRQTTLRSVPRNALENGRSSGFQEGTQGKSYAIQTIWVPGKKRSVPLSEIETQFVELFLYAENHPELEFLLTPVGSKLAGYTAVEMKETFDSACHRKNPPKNIIVPEHLY